MDSRSLLYNRRYENADKSAAASAAGQHDTTEKGASSEHRIVQFHQPESRRVRLRRAVRAADRPPRTRFERVLGDRPVRHHRRRGARDGAGRHHPVRRPRLRQRRGRAARRPRHLRAGRADPGLLLRPSGDLRHLGRQRVPPRGGRIRPRHAARHRRPAVRGHARRSNRVDEPFRCREGRSRRLYRGRLHRRVPRGRHGVPRAQDLHHAVPSRSQAHRVRQPDAEKLPVRHLRP